MTFLEIALLVVTVVLAAALAWSLRTLYNLGIIVLSTQDELENSLEIIDERVESMNKILDIPLFSDSPEIKKLRSDMIKCRESILDIAYALSDTMQQDKEYSSDTETT